MPPNAQVGQRYPRTITLDDGREIIFRLMGAGDEDLSLHFARGLDDHDLLFLRTDITDPAVVAGWVGRIEAGETVTVLALDADELGVERVVGYGSLHLNLTRWTRHVGEIRLLIGNDVRGGGLGRRLASEVFSIASMLGLRKITAQMTPDQAGARATFNRLGFAEQALLPDYVMDRDGHTRDLVLMSYDVDGFSDSA